MCLPKRGADRSLHDGSGRPAAQPPQYRCSRISSRVCVARDRGRHAPEGPVGGMPPADERVPPKTDPRKGGGGVQCSLDPKPLRRAGGGSGCSKFFSGGLGAFLNPPFHSEHFEYAQVRGAKSPDARLSGVPEGGGHRDSRVRRSFGEAELAEALFPIGVGLRSEEGGSGHPCPPHPPCLCRNTPSFWTACE